MKPKLLDGKRLAEAKSELASSRTVRRLVAKKLQRRNRNMRYRYITYPEPLPLLDLDGTQIRDKETDKPRDMSLKQFVETMTSDPAFVSDTPKDPTTVNWNMSAIVSATTVATLFAGKKPGDIVAIEDDDWQKLRRAVEKGNYHPVLARSLIPYMRLIINAPDEDPEKKTKGAASSASESDKEAS